MSKRAAIQNAIERARNETAYPAYVSHQFPLPEGEQDRYMLIRVQNGWYVRMGDHGHLRALLAYLYDPQERLVVNGKKAEISVPPADFGQWTAAVRQICRLLDVRYINFVELGV